MTDDQTPQPVTPADTTPVGTSPVAAEAPVAAQESLPQAPAAPMPPAPHKPASGLDKRMIAVVAAILAVGILVFGILYVRSASQPEEEPLVPVTPTMIPTPTPLPNLSRISSTSAFLNFSQEVASFAGVLNAFTLQDASLTPPILDSSLDLQ